VQSLRHLLSLPFLRGKYAAVGGRLGMPRPDDAPTAHAPGIDPDRVLVFGNGAAVGWGVRSHDLALPGQLARRVAAATGRGIDVDLVADPLLTIRTAAQSVPVSRLAAYDAVVVVVGMSDALRLTSPRKWRAGMSALLETLKAHIHDGASIMVVGISTPSAIKVFSMREGSVVDSHAEALNAITRPLCSAHDGVEFVPAPCTPARATANAESRSTLAPELFKVWGAELAARLSPALDEQFLRGRAACPNRDRIQTEEERLAAIHTLGILDSPHEKRFDDIVERARILLGTAGAAFSVVDHDRVWNKALAGSAVVESPLRGAMCAETITTNAPFVVPDVWHDDRFVTHPSVRFYAGHPIETAEGIRIGALCVTDPDPRAVDSVDLVLLRELALSLQKELRSTAALA
jgi:hypothetical protein